MMVWIMYAWWLEEESCEVVSERSKQKGEVSASRREAFRRNTSAKENNSYSWLVDGKYGLGTRSVYDRNTVVRERETEVRMDSD